MQKRCEHLDEAQTELMLVDEEDSTRFLVGECFLHIPNDDADQRLGTGSISISSQSSMGSCYVSLSQFGMHHGRAELAQLQKEIGELEAAEVELQGTRDGLKEVRYACNLDVPSPVARSRGAQKHPHAWANQPLACRNCTTSSGTRSIWTNRVTWTCK